MSATPTDHAELARLAERCTHGDPWYSGDDLRGRQTFGQFLPQDRAFIAAANPARVLALLAEIAARELEKERLGRVLMTMQESIPPAYHPNGSGLRLFIASLKADKTEAERKLDEAVGLLRPFGLAADNMDGDEPDGLFIYDSPESTMISYGDLRAVRTFLASLTADHVSDARQMVQPEQIAENVNCSPTGSGEA